MASSAPAPPPKKLKMSSTSSEPEHETESTTIERKPRYKRRKVAIFIAYCGFGYQGMQKNPGARTIESDLEEALYLSGAVPESDKYCPKRYDWARSARTDKGVSAVGQVVSGRFYVDPPGFVERLNSNLSDQIRVFGFKRVTNSFSAKKFCDRRRYVYLLPVFALDPNSHPDRESVLASVGSGNELAKCFECSERGRKVVGIMGKQSRVWKEEEMSEVDVKNGDVDEKFDNGSIDLKDRGSRVSKEEGVGKLDVGNGGINVKVEIGTGELKHEDLRVLKEEEMSVGSGNELALCFECSERGRKVIGIMGKQSRVCKEEEMSELDVKNGDVDENFHIGSTDLKDRGSRVSKEEGIGKLDVGNDGINEKVEFGIGKLKHEDPRVLIEEEMRDTSTCNLNSEDTTETEIRVTVEEGKSEIADSKVLTVEISENVTNGEKIVMEDRSKFEYGDKEKERFNSILKRYEGTHNFHNFTTRTKAEDPSARRYIISFSADRVVSIEGIEFVRFEVVGQSFMLHQIRKMIGLAVAMMRNCCPESLMNIALRQDININVPTAPEVGLYLDECFFTSYNHKWKDSHEKLTMEAYAEEAEEFKLKNIFSHIASMEHKEGAVALWLHSLNHRNYPDFHFQESNGRLIDSEDAQIDKLAD